MTGPRRRRERHRDRAARRRVEPRPGGPRVTRAAGMVAGLAAGWLALALVAWACGEAPRAIGGQLLAGTWGMPYGIGQVLYKATTLLLTGVAVDVALRAGLFNIGVEGQLAVAGLAVATACAHLPAGTPGLLALPVALVVALAAGAIWAALPALLRARFGAHEVISTIMMNRIADAAVGVALARGLALPGSARTPDVAAGARLAPLASWGLPSMHGSAASTAWPVALFVAVLAAAWIARSRVGREIVLVGLGRGRVRGREDPRRAPRRRRAPRLRRHRRPRRDRPGARLQGLLRAAASAPARASAGIAVALIGRRSVVGLVLAALFFGTLEQGGLAINARIPMEITTILEAVAIVAVALADVRAAGIGKRVEAGGAPASTGPAGTARGGP